MPGSVMISLLGMKPLATSIHSGFTAASSYTKQAKMVAHSTRTSACAVSSESLETKKHPLADANGRLGNTSDGRTRAWDPGVQS